MKSLYKRIKTVFWEGYNGIAAAGLFVAAALLVLNIVFIDWDAFVYHGIFEEELTNADFMYHIIRSIQYIIYIFVGASIIFYIVVIAAKIDKTWSKIVCYATMATNVFLFIYTLHFAFGLQESLQELLLENISYILFGGVFLFLLVFFVARSRFRNKLVAACITVVIVGLSVLPFVPKTAFAFGGHPAVYDGGDCYVVVWTTTNNALAWINAEIGGETLSIYDKTNAVANVNSRYHKVSVPKIDKNGNPVTSFSYTVYSKKLLWRTAAFFKYGKQIASKKYHFDLAPIDADTVTVGVFSDVHGQYDMASRVVGYMGESDFYILLGDMATAVFSQEKALRIVDFAGAVSRGEKLVYPVRGNHEDRGTYYQLWGQYTVTPGGKLYYTIEYNGLNAVVLDTGSDYPDDAPINGGATFWQENTAEQLEWLESISYEGAKWRAAVSHINFMYDDYLYNDITSFGERLYAKGADILIHGHKHRIGAENNFMYPGDYEEILFPSYAVGGYKHSLDTYAASQIKFLNSHIAIKQYDNNNKVRIDQIVALA